MTKEKLKSYYTEALNDEIVGAYPLYSQIVKDGESERLGEFFFFLKYSLKNYHHSPNYHSFGNDLDLFKLYSALFDFIKELKEGNKEASLKLNIDRYHLIVFAFESKNIIKELLNDK